MNKVKAVKEWISRKSVRCDKGMLKRSAQRAGWAATIGIVIVVWTYFNGVPFIQYRAVHPDTRNGRQATALEKTSASYISLFGTREVMANEFGAGCPDVIWIPVSHVDGLDDKLPFSLLKRLEELLGAPSDAPPQSVL